MKKLLAILVSLFAIIPVFAAPGFYMHKHTDVTGEYKWNGASWQSGDWTTATFDMDTTSNQAKNAFYGEHETLNEWKYDLSSYTQTDARTDFHNTLDAWTVNPPDTTPGTAWTRYEYNQETRGTHSASFLYVEGKGSVVVDSYSTVKSPSEQWIDLDLN